MYALPSRVPDRIVASCPLCNICCSRAPGQRFRHAVMAVTLAGTKADGSPPGRATWNDRESRSAGGTIIGADGRECLSLVPTPPPSPLSGRGSACVARDPGRRCPGRSGDEELTRPAVMGFLERRCGVRRWSQCVPGARGPLMVPVPDVPGSPSNLLLPPPPDCISQRAAVDRPDAAKDAPADACAWPYGNPTACKVPGSSRNRPRGLVPSRLSRKAIQTPGDDCGAAAGMVKWPRELRIIFFERVPNSIRASTPACACQH